MKELTQEELSAILRHLDGLWATIKKIAKRTLIKTK